MFVVAYDISDDRRRTRVFKTLKRYGTAVQESVFECHLTADQFVKMRLEVEAVIDPQLDQVRYYDLCQKCAGRIQATSASRITSDPDAIIV
ncbi:CRISPR-associated endonuclease Cas2 [candidate division KSB1 bacterium]|nr:CRISPR-associated endonuclease Cas2 [candidate division KSB1 bacterium]